MSEYSSPVLDTNECLRLLASTSLGRVAFTVDTLPALAPVRFRLLDRHLIGFRTVNGSPLDTATRDGIVAFEADSTSADDGSWSVTVIGRSTIATAEDEVAQLASLPISAARSDESNNFVLLQADLVQGHRHNGSAARAVPPQRGPVHEAFFYAGAREFLHGVKDHVRSALSAAGPILVVVSPEAIDSLRTQLGPNAARVEFVNVRDVGQNPTRMIPLLLQFLAEHAGQSISIVTEPIWPGRPAAEYATAVQTEALFNLALEERPADVACICAYDVVALDPGAVQDAMRTHAVIVGYDRRTWWSLHYDDPARVASQALHPLPRSPVDPHRLSVHAPGPPGVREFIDRYATQAGMAANRVDELVLAVAEAATDVVGIPTELRLWRERTSLVCDIHSPRHLTDPLTGRWPPPTGNSPVPRGLARANDVCSLVQIDLQPSGTTIRLHMSLEGRPDR